MALEQAKPHQYLCLDVLPVTSLKVSRQRVWHLQNRTPERGERWARVHSDF